MLEFHMGTEDVERAAEIILRPLEGRFTREQVVELVREKGFRDHIRQALEAYLMPSPPEVEFETIPRIEPLPPEQFEEKLEQVKAKRKKGI